MPRIRENARQIFSDILRANSEPESPKEAVLKAVMPHLEALGMEVSIHDNDGNPSIFAATPDPKVLLNGHLDTVSQGSGWNFGTDEEADGKIYGRGALDMKGPCVSLLIAAEQLISEGMGIAIAFTTDEEVGMAGAKVLAAAHPEISDFKLIIVCEPTDMKPVFEERGLVQFALKITGKSAHGSMPEQGHSAVMDLNMAIDAFLASDFFGWTSTDPVTINIGLISGGTLINMVPDHAQAEFDIRYSPDFSEAGVMEEAVKVLDPLGIDYELEITRKIPPARSGFPESLANALQDLFGPWDKVTYATEMAVFAALNKNIFVLGPGEPGRAHKPDEFITMEEIMDGAEAFVKAARLVK